MFWFLKKIYHKFMNISRFFVLYIMIFVLLEQNGGCTEYKRSQKGKASDGKAKRHFQTQALCI